MKLTNQEIKVLISKYISEGLNKKQIKRRLLEMDLFNDYIKFKYKYLKNNF